MEEDITVAGSLPVCGRHWFCTLSLRIPVLWPLHSRRAW